MNETLNGFARLITALVATDGSLARELVEALQQRVPSVLHDLASSRDAASDRALSDAVYAVLEQYGERIEAALRRLD
ncbi:MAG: hypothetical protein HY330_00675 [Chloroflexi bacterium]|nr:hypothetical protein [Chloroflexota bacterium]